jgi:hypothetical protein
MMINNYHEESIIISYCCWFFQIGLRHLLVILENVAVFHKLRWLFVCSQLPSYSLSSIHMSTRSINSYPLHQHGFRQRAWSELLKISDYTQVTVCDHRGYCSWPQCYHSYLLLSHGSRQRAWSELLKISDSTQVTVCDHQGYCSWFQCYDSSTLHQHGSRQRAWSELLKISDYTEVTVRNHQGYYSWFQCYDSSMLHQHGSRQRAWSELLRIYV